MLVNNGKIKSSAGVFLAAACLALLTSCAGAVETAGPPAGEGPVATKATSEVSLSFDGTNALSFVFEQLAMGPRTSGDGKQLKLRDRLAEKLGALGFKVDIQALIGATGAGKGVAFYNVVATLDPPAFSRQRLFGAHYDTIPMAPNDPDPARRMTPIDGANDGASGVAVLMELARVVSSRRAELRHSIKLIFFDGEDFSTGTENMFYGSRYYAANLAKEDAAKIEYLIVVDMIGDSDLNVYQDRNSLAAYPALTAGIFSAAAEAGVKGFYASPKYAIIDDHMPFIDAGVPAAVLIDFDYPYWHTTADKADRVSARSLEQCGKLLEYLIFYK